MKLNDYVTKLDIMQLIIDKAAYARRENGELKFCSSIYGGTEDAIDADEVAKELGLRPNWRDALDAIDY
jgi:hypothetical protein